VDVSRVVPETALQDAGRCGAWSQPQPQPRQRLLLVDAVAVAGCPI